MPLASTLPNLLTFCTTFELGSFSKAARKLGVTPQAASRSVLRLEETLGSVLFRRTTRLLTPTDAARAYYLTAKQALDLLARAETEFTRHDQVQAGIVRFSVPTTFAHHRLLPTLPAFRERYPAVELEVHIENRNVDFLSEDYDFAIRREVIRNQALVARKIGEFGLGVYAAPAYVARYGVPRTPDQLAKHAAIGFVLPSTGRLLNWSFAPGPRVFTPSTALRCAGDPLGTITLARSGAGLIQTYDFLVEKDVERGLLIEVLRDFRGPDRPFSLIHPKRPARSAAARSLIDYLLERRR